jgi:hypothetical protein
MRRWWVRLLAGLVVVALLLVAAVYVVSNTDWGRERVRRYVLNLIQNNSHGIVHIGSVSGNLLHGITLGDVVITDSAHAPFVKADQISANYSLMTLRGKKLDFSHVKLVRAVIVIDKQPGGKWNYDRIFPRDTTTSTGKKPSGWGTWIRFSDVTVVDGDLAVRSPWAPDDSLNALQKNDAIRRALGPDGRLAVVQVRGGYQKISTFHKINALFPLVRLEDPAYKSRMVDVAALKMIAEPFRPPVADVRGLTGTFEFTGDSVWWKGARAAFPRTKLSGDGRYYINNGNMHLRLHADPVDPADVRWAMVNLPEQGSGKLDFGLDWVGKKSVYTLLNMDATLVKSHLVGHARLSKWRSAFHHTRHAAADEALSDDEVPATVDSHRPGEIQRWRAFAHGERRRHDRRQALRAKSPRRKWSDGNREWNIQREQSSRPDAAAPDAPRQVARAHAQAHRHYDRHRDTQRHYRRHHDGTG